MHGLKGLDDGIMGVFSVGAGAKPIFLNVSCASIYQVTRTDT